LRRCAKLHNKADKIWNWGMGWMKLRLSFGNEFYARCIQNMRCTSHAGCGRGSFRLKPIEEAKDTKQGGCRSAEACVVVNKLSCSGRSYEHSREQKSRSSPTSIKNFKHTAFKSNLSVRKIVEPISFCCSPPICILNTLHKWLNCPCISFSS